MSDFCDFACPHGAWCMLPRHHDGDHNLMIGSDAVLVIRAPMPDVPAAVDLHPGSARIIDEHNARGDLFERLAGGFWPLPDETEEEFKARVLREMEQAK